MSEIKKKEASSKVREPARERKNKKKCEEKPVKEEKPMKPYNNYKDACNVFKKNELYYIN